MSDDEPKRVVGKPFTKGVSGNPNKVFKPGQSGNPGGRAQGIERQVRELIGDDLPKLIAAQVRIARGLPPLEAPDMEIKAADSTRACDSLIDRGWGKPKQTIDATVSDGTDTEADWGAVSLEDKRALLQTIALVVGNNGDDTEH